MRYHAFTPYFVRSIVLLALLAITSTCTSAQTANAFLDVCAATMGSINAEQPFYAEGDIAFADTATASQHIVWKAMGADLFRQETSSKTDPLISIVNHGTGLQKQASITKPLSHHATAYFRQEYIPALACTVDRSRNGMAAEYLGDEKVAGELAHHLLFYIAPVGKNKGVDETERALSEYHVFLSVATNQVLMTRTWLFSPDAVENRSLWETFYRDYRNVNGVLMPFDIENRLAGKRFREIILTTVRTDSSVSESDFQ
jgi:hypothetical protein